MNVGSFDVWRQRVADYSQQVTAAEGSTRSTMECASKLLAIDPASTPDTVKQVQQLYGYQKTVLQTTIDMVEQDATQARYQGPAAGNAARDLTSLVTRLRAQQAALQVASSMVKQGPPSTPAVVQAPTRVPGIVPPPVRAPAASMAPAWAGLPNHSSGFAGTPGIFMQQQALSQLLQAGAQPRTTPGMMAQLLQNPQAVASVVPVPVAVAPASPPPIVLDSSCGLPKVAVFDLDETCWKHVGLDCKKPKFVAPFAWCEAARKVLDSKGTPVNMYPELVSVLLTLHQAGIAIAVASHDGKPAWCREVMDSQQLEDTGLTWGQLVRPDLTVISWTGAYWPKKQKHLQDICERLPCTFGDMIFFDDSKSICAHSADLGVIAVRCMSGVTLAKLEEALQAWRCRNAGAMTMMTTMRGVKRPAGTLL